MNLKLLNYYYLELKIGATNLIYYNENVIICETLKYFEKFAILNSVCIRQESKALSPDNKVIQGVRSCYAVAVNVRCGKTVRVW
jgi:hypothetical protein